MHLYVHFIARRHPQIRFRHRKEHLSDTHQPPFRKNKMASGKSFQKEIKWRIFQTPKKSSEIYV